MFALNQSRICHRLLTFDDLSKKTQCKNLKFKRAFEFLQLLFLQRVYGLDITTRTSFWPLIKSVADDNDDLCEVFLGGSCNPTTWRHEHAIPYFRSRSISYYNPQVAEWTPDLVEIEHQAKESALLLFFVIDPDTRSLAAIAEVCYLIACERNIIVIMNPMPTDKYQTVFIQQKHERNEEDNHNDYENACKARETLRILLHIKRIPLFDNVAVGLEYAAFLIKNRKQMINYHKSLSEDKTRNLNDQKVTCLPSDNELSEPADNIPHDLIQSTSIDLPSTALYRRHSATPTLNSTQDRSLRNAFFQSTSLKKDLYYHSASVDSKPNLLLSTSETDDDGYGSFVSSTSPLSRSSSSSCTTPDSSESSTVHSDNDESSRLYLSISILNIMISVFSTYVSFTNGLTTSNTSILKSLNSFYKVSSDFIRYFLLYSAKNTVVPAKIEQTRSLANTFDLYIASGDHDECWINTFVLPMLDGLNVKYIKRQNYHDNDQHEIIHGISIATRSHLLYYLINGTERLSNLVSELAFLIGERKYHIIVYLQTTIDNDADQILTNNERQDIQRSRKYLESLATKENILLCKTREQSCQHVLAFFLQS